MDWIINSQPITIKDAINSLYKTKCRACGIETFAMYYVWDTIYKLNEKFKAKLSIKYEILLDAIKTVLNLKTYPNEISQNWLNENWDKILEYCNSKWEKKYPKIKNPFNVKRPSSVTNVFGRLVQKNIYIRNERKPIFIFYKCSNKNCSHRNGRLEKLNDYDWYIINLIEKIKIPFIFPKNQLKYPTGKLFDTARPDSLFIPNESLATWTNNELKKYDEKFHHLYTKRNLLALSILFNSIEKLKDKDNTIKEILLLSFTRTLILSAKMDTYREEYKTPVFSWTINRFSIPPSYVEHNVLNRFIDCFANIYKAKEQCNKEIGNYFNEASNVDDFVNNPEKSILILCIDARDIDKLFKKYKDVADMVFTDPPYGDAIQYFELCSFFVSWLILDKEWKQRYGDMQWWKNEIIVNEPQNKSLEDFSKQLADAFKSTSSIVVDDATWVITYHKREPKYWNALSDSLISCGLSFFSETLHKLLGKSFNPNKDFRFMGEDAYTVWKRAEAEVKITDLLTVTKEFFSMLRTRLRENNGLLRREDIYEAFNQLSWKTDKEIYQNFFSQSFDKFLERHMIELPFVSRFKEEKIIEEKFFIINRDKAPEGVPLNFWKEKWDELYKNISFKNLVEKSIIGYLIQKEKSGEVPTIDELYSDILNHIDGRSNKQIIMRILEEISDYDWLTGKIKLKEELKFEKKVTLHKFIKKKPLVSIPNPFLFTKDLAEALIRSDFKVYINEDEGYSSPEIIARYAFISSSYLRKLVQEIRLDDFPLVSIKDDKIFCFEIQDFRLTSHVVRNPAVNNYQIKFIILHGKEEVEKYSKDLKEFSDKIIIINVRNYNNQKELIDKILRVVK